MKTLNVGERLILCSILPKEGSFVTLKVIRGLINKLGLSAQELKEYDVKEENGLARWNSKGLEYKDFDFEEVEYDMIKKQLKELDSQNKLTNETVSLFEKFCT